MIRNLRGDQFLPVPCDMPRVIVKSVIRDQERNIIGEPGRSETERSDLRDGAQRRRCGCRCPVKVSLGSAWSCRQHEMLRLETRLIELSVGKLKPVAVEPRSDGVVVRESCVYPNRDDTTICWGCHRCR